MTISSKFFFKSEKIKSFINNFENKKTHEIFKKSIKIEINFLFFGDRVVNRDINFFI